MASLSDQVKDLDMILSHLTPEEIKKSAGFYFEKDRVKFIQGRFLLKSIIANYLGIHIKAIRFEYNKYGKPKLANNDQFCFNVSHSHNMITIALTINCSMGIDIEFIKDDNINDLIDKEIFTQKEMSLLNSLCYQERIKAFYKLWSCKEAYVKALGLGLSIPLSSLEVDPGYKIIAQTANFQAPSKPHHLINLENLPRDYAGTLAIADRPFYIKYLKI